MSAVALIPARAGSKRLPGKNIAPFFGHPLIAFTIASAISADVFDRVLVSTEDPRYGAAAEHYGAEIIERPAELASDTSDLPSVALDALDRLARGGERPDILCLLMPTCPLRRAGTVRAHLNRFIEAGRHFQLSTVRYLNGAPQWALQIGEAGELEYFLGRDYFRRKQELDRLVCPSGAIWLVRVSDFEAQRRFYGEPLHGEEIDAIEGIDIDDPEDLELAEALVLGFEARGRALLEPIAQPPWVT